MLIPLIMNKTQLASAGESIKGGVHTLVEHASEAADQIKVRVVEITDTAKTKGGAFYDQVAAVVKARPFEAVGIAFAVGYLAMRINTSKLTPLAVIGALGYFGTKILRR